MKLDNYVKIEEWFDSSLGQTTVVFFLIYFFLLFFTTYNNFNSIYNVNSKEKNKLNIVSLFFGSIPPLFSAENY